MTATIRTELVGVRQAVASLNKIEPGLRKQFAAELNQIAAPAIQAAQQRYTYLGVPLSGMQNKWQQAGRSRANFPYTVAKAVKGVQVKLDTRRNATSTIVISQVDPAAAIFETAGRATSNKLGNALGFVGAGRTRIIGPAVYKSRRGIEVEMTKMIAKTMRVVQAGL